MGGITRTDTDHRTKIRITGQQLAFIREAHPHCRFEDLAEVTFEFDRAGNVVDCTAKTNRNAPERDYAGAGLTILYAIARKRFVAWAQGSATVLQFPPANNGSRALA